MIAPMPRAPAHTISKRTIAGILTMYRKTAGSTWEVASLHLVNSWMVIPADSCDTQYPSTSCARRRKLEKVTARHWTFRDVTFRDMKSHGADSTLFSFVGSLCVEQLIDLWKARSSNCQTVQTKLKKMRNRKTQKAFVAKLSPYGSAWSSWKTSTRFFVFVVVFIVEVVTSVSLWVM